MGQTAISVFPDAQGLLAERAKRLRRVPPQLVIGVSIEREERLDIDDQLARWQRSLAAPLTWTAAAVGRAMFKGSDYGNGQVYRSGKTLAHDAGLPDLYTPGKLREGAARKSAPDERRTTATQQTYYRCLRELEAFGGEGIFAREWLPPRHPRLRELGLDLTCAHRLWPGRRGVCACPWNRGMSILTVAVRTLAELRRLARAQVALAGEVRVRIPRAAREVAQPVKHAETYGMIRDCGSVGFRGAEMTQKPAETYGVIRDQRCDPKPSARAISDHIALCVLSSPLESTSPPPLSICTAAEVPERADSDPGQGVLGEGGLGASGGTANAETETEQEASPTARNSRSLSETPPAETERHGGRESTKCAGFVAPPSANAPDEMRTALRGPENGPSAALPPGSQAPEAPEAIAPLSATAAPQTAIPERTMSRTEDHETVRAHWVAAYKRDGHRLSPGERTRIDDRLEFFELADVLAAITQARRSEYNRPGGGRDGLLCLLRPATFERLLSDARSAAAAPKVATAHREIQRLDPKDEGRVGIPPEESARILELLKDVTDSGERERAAIRERLRDEAFAEDPGRSAAATRRRLDEQVARLGVAAAAPNPEQKAAARRNQREELERLGYDPVVADRMVADMWGDP